MSSGGCESYPYAQVRDWPRYRDEDGGGVVLPGDRIKLPGSGAAVYVLSISFGMAPGGAYINGFLVRADERVESYERKAV